MLLGYSSQCDLQRTTTGKEREWRRQPCLPCLFYRMAIQRIAVCKLKQPLINLVGDIAKTATLGQQKPCRSCCATTAPRRSTSTNRTPLDAITRRRRNRSASFRDLLLDCVCQCSDTEVRDSHVASSIEDSQRTCSNM